MIDLDEFRMKRDIEILISDIESARVGAGQMMVNVHLAAANELITRLRQAEKDAARYRWLRDCGCFEGNANDFFYMDPRDTDSAIDEAMQCNK